MLNTVGDGSRVDLHIYRTSQGDTIGGNRSIVGLLHAPHSIEYQSSGMPSIVHYCNVQKRFLGVRDQCLDLSMSAIRQFIAFHPFGYHHSSRAQVVMHFRDIAIR